MNQVVDMSERVVIQTNIEKVLIIPPAQKLNNPVGYGLKFTSYLFSGTVKILSFKQAFH